METAASLPPPITISKINTSNTNEIISRLRSLIKNSEYRVYGIWLCQERSCQNEWESVYSPERFSKYLSKAERHSFRRKCWTCGGHSKVQFESIKLYKQQDVSKESSVTKIVRQLTLHKNLYELKGTETQKQEKRSDQLAKVLNQTSADDVNETETQDISNVVYGYWFCRQWKCRHKPECERKMMCQDKWQRQHKWQCQHWRQCRTFEQCKKKYCSCRSEHEWKCQNDWLSQHEWECKHKQKCRSEWQCQHEWHTKYHLKDLINKNDGFFKVPCKECEGKSESPISSFRLYAQQPKSTDEIPIIEIVCRLEFNNYYRVFGNWECADVECNESWKSSYTWISLQKFMGLAKDLEPANYYMQGCNKCDNPDNNILEYNPLQKSENGNRHKRGLCVKCLYYDSCR